MAVTERKIGGEYNNTVVEVVGVSSHNLDTKSIHTIQILCFAKDTHQHYDRNRY